MFEGVCLTTVILAPGACGGRLRAAPRDIKSPDAPDAPDAADAAECSEKRVLGMKNNENEKCHSKM